MDFGWIIGGSTAAAFAGGGAWWAGSRRRGAPKKSQPTGQIDPRPSLISDAPGALAVAEAVPDELLIGESPEQAVVAIRPTNSRTGFENAVTLDLKGELVNRFSSLLQAAPTVLVAGGCAGKRLMEVVIRGDLTAAADGNGFRAFAMQGKKIVEHARLFDTTKLQTMVNAAAVWQVASVLVAQKHLADISQKLNEIKSAVHGVSQFLDQQRRARIQSTYDYLAQVARAIGAGNLSASARGEIESCERDLLEIHRHLLAQFRSVAGERVKHIETIGTEILTRDIGDKIKKLEEIAADIHMCLRTRIGAWHVLSAFPGEAHLIKARRASIEASCEEMRDIGIFFSAEIEADIDLVKSRFNRRTTMDERKAELGRKRDGAKQSLAAKSAQAAESIQRTMDQLLLQNQPTRILVAVDNSRIVEVHQALPRAA